MTGPKIPTPEEVAYMQAHADDDLRPNIIACAAICGALGTTFVVFRLLSRRVAHGSFRFEASDWLTIAAWILFVPFNVTLGLLAKYGGGRHIILVTNAKALQILTIIDENLYVTILALLKWSILSIYRTLFGSSVWFYRMSWGVTVLVGLLLIQVVVSTNLQCIPISESWAPTGKGTCINYGAEALVAYIINILTDLTILTMPIPLVLHLQTSKSRKQGLLIVFCAGGSACIVSIVQLAFITRLGSTSDGSWDNMPSAFLGAIEITMGFLATSIVTYRPLYQHLFKGGITSSGYIRDKQSGFSGSASTRQPHTGNQSYTPRVFTGGHHTYSDNESTESRRGITVTNQFEMTTYDVKADQARDKW